MNRLDKGWTALDSLLGLVAFGMVASVLRGLWRLGRLIF